MGKTTEIYKGQLTVEFMLIFVITLSVISLITTALLAQRAAILEKKDAVEKIIRAEAAARATEVWHNSGIHMDADFKEEGVFVHAEYGRFRIDYNGKIIDIAGVFHNERAEPV